LSGIPFHPFAGVHHRFARPSHHVAKVYRSSGGHHEFSATSSRSVGRSDHLFATLSRSSVCSHRLSETPHRRFETVYRCIAWSSLTSARSDGAIARPLGWFATPSKPSALAKLFLGTCRHLRATNLLLVGNALYCIAVQIESWVLWASPGGTLHSRTSFHFHVTGRSVHSGIFYLPSFLFLFNI